MTKRFVVRAYRLGDAEWTLIKETDDGFEAMRAQSGANDDKSWQCVMMSRTNTQTAGRIKGFGPNDSPRDHYIATHHMSDPKGKNWIPAKETTS